MDTVKMMTCFLKKHRNTTVTFEYDIDLDEYIIVIRDFANNKAWEYGVSGVEFENNQDIIIGLTLEKAETVLFNKQ